MLRIKSTVHNTGIMVSGSYDDLKELYNAFVSVIGDEGDYCYNAAPRRRVLGVCNEILHAYQGECETIKGDYNIPYYAFRILWPEAAFVTAVLDNFVLISSAKKLYIDRFPEEELGMAIAISADKIALIHYFQDLVWNDLERIVGEWQVREIFGEYNELRKIHFKFPQLDGYCTQWLDILNTQYLCSEPERRRFYLVYVLKKIFTIEEEYLSLKDSIKVYEEQAGILVTGISLSDCLSTNDIYW